MKKEKYSFSDVLPLENPSNLSVLNHLMKLSTIVQYVGFKTFYHHYIDSSILVESSSLVNRIAVYILSNGLFEKSTISEIEIKEYINIVFAIRKLLLEVEENVNPVTKDNEFIDEMLDNVKFLNTSYDRKLESLFQDEEESENPF